MIYKKCIHIWRTRLNDELLNKFYLKFTYCTNKLGNTEITLADVENIFENNNIDSLKICKRAIKNIIRFKKVCIDFFNIHEENRSKLSIGLIKNLYESLTDDYFIKEFKDKEKNELIELIEEINNTEIDDSDALSVISYFICKFNRINYCNDERIEIILMNYLLLRRNFAPIIIFYTDIEEYYLALEQFNKNQDVSEMVKFLEEQAYKNWLKNYNVKMKKLKDFL